MRQVYLFASLALLPSAANGLHTRTSWSKGDLSSALRPAGVPLATFEDCEVGECDVDRDKYVCVVYLVILVKIIRPKKVVVCLSLSFSYRKGRNYPLIW